LILGSVAAVESVIIDPVDRHALSFVARVKSLYPSAKAIAALTPGCSTASHLSAFDASAPKPERRTPAAAQAWVDLVRALAPPSRRTGA
jgi:hypothetical protein